MGRRDPFSIEDEALAGVFRTLDAGRDGYITIDDLSRLRSAKDLTGEQLTAIFEAAGADGEGRITEELFCERLRQSQFFTEALTLFDKLDIDKSGGLSKDEVVLHLESTAYTGTSPVQDVVESMMKMGDIDHDQRLNFKEFFILLTKAEHHLPVLHALGSTGGDALHGLPKMPSYRDLGKIAVDLVSFDDVAVATSEVNSAYKAAGTLFCGGCAGIIAKTSVAPIQRVKLLFQVTDRPFSVWKSAQMGFNIVKDEGFLSLWRGNSAVIVRTLPYVSIHFLAHDLAEDYLRNHPTEQLSAGRKFAAGAFAGVCGTICTYPLDLIRANLAVGPAKTWTSLVHDIYGRRGLGGFYRGLLVTLVGIVPYTGIAWTIKGKLNEKVKEMRKKRKLTSVEKLSCGAFAGFVAQGVTYPLEMIRRRMQMPVSESLGNTDAKNTVKTLIRTEGFAGLFKGFSLNVVKGPVAIGISFATFDTLKEYFGLAPKGLHNR
eukprot:CAMPEP_0114516958 /NCGR_PEP_ID=MMETSP0109-20121206/17625_1 /TAXON_ID=29199 /ORGANISM="Chlorarachnion reptans, Strain CCCM449" /LENGTH=486 /DNA_ID=CAMNT_0001697421 /DNA_START=209 /DNA_END=1669 /DNA_ORIENTATION=-